MAVNWRVDGLRYVNSTCVCLVSHNMSSMSMSALKIAESHKDKSI